MEQPATPKRRGRRPKSPDGILDALESLLAHRPLHELGIDEILEATNVARATFYLHYPTKYAAAVALFDRVLDEITATMSAFVARDDETPVLDALREGIRSSTATWFRHKAILETVVQNAHAVPEFEARLSRIKLDFSRTIAKEIERERVLGLAPDGPAVRPLCAVLVECTLQLLYRAGASRTKDFPGSRSIGDSIFALWCGAVYHVPPPS